MSTVNAIRGPAITIASAGTASNVIRMDECYFAADAITLVAPATLDATTFTIQVTQDPDASPVVWTNLNDGVADVSAPLASKTSVYPGPSYPAFRILAGSAVAADRTWQMFIAESLSGSRF